MKHGKARSPYEIIRSRHVTEKAMMLQELHTSESNPSLARCKSPKVVFLVDKRANKYEIAGAVEEIYAKQSVKVVKVNVINNKPKKRRVRGRVGYAAGFKKAVVTFADGDRIEDM